MSKRKIPRSKQQELAIIEIKKLFQQAEETFPKDRAWSNRLIRKARRAAMKVKLKMPRELKRKYCKYCYSFLMPGVNSRLRTRAGKVIISCFECKKFTRIPLKKN